MFFNVFYLQINVFIVYGYGWYTLHTTRSSGSFVRFLRPDAIGHAECLAVIYLLCKYFGDFRYVNRTGDF